MIKEPSLLPCPFCGGVPEISENRMKPTMKGPGSLITADIRHWCDKKSGCVFAFMEFRARDRDSVIQQWNVRNGC